MRVYTNTKLVKARARVGYILSLAGLGILVIGLIGALQQTPESVALSYFALVVGLIASNVGGRFIDRWIRPPAGGPLNHDLLAKVLKGFDHKHYLYNYLLPANHVFLSPQGLAVFTIKDQEGDIYFDGQRWLQPASLGRVWRDFRHGGLGNPTREIRDQVAKLRHYLAQELPEVEVPIEGLIIFRAERAKLKLSGSQESVLTVKTVKNHLLKTRERSSPLPAQTYRALIEKLQPDMEAIEAE